MVDPTTVVVEVDDSGSSVVLDFGFGSIQIDGVTGGGTFTSIEDINDSLGYEAITLI
ncbi:hypothetical protein D3C87_2164030 [compost metagenome]